MGDVRFDHVYERVRQAPSQAAAIRHMLDEEVVAALAGAAMARDPYLANVLATEAQNRARVRETIVRIAGEGLVTLDADGTTRFLNPAAARMLGHDPSSLEGEPFHDRVHRDAEGRLAPWGACPVCTTVLHRGQTLHGVEAFFRHKDGRLFPVTLTASPILRDREVEGAVLVFRDVTEQHEARTRLQDSEERYRSLFLHNPDAVFSFDLEGLFTSVNPALERMSGYPADELMGTSFLPLVDPSEREGVTERFRRAAQGEAQSYAATMYRRDGERLLVEVTNLPITSGGRIVGVYGIAKDVTRRKRAEDALRQSEERLRLLIESARDHALYALDPRGNVVSWTPTAARMKGYRADEVLGRSYAMFHEPADREAGLPEAALAAALVQGRHETEAWLLRKDGTRFWAHLTLAPLHDAAGSLVGFARVTHDLTERKRFEDALRASEARFRGLYDDVPAMYFTLALDGTLLSANRYGAQYLGFLPEDLTGRSILDITHPEDHALVEGRLRAFLAERPPFDKWEFRKRTKAGDVLFVRDVVRLIRGSDGREIILNVCEDVTEQRRRDAALARLQETPPGTIG